MHASLASLNGILLQLRAASPDTPAAAPSSFEQLLAMTETHAHAAVSAIADVRPAEATAVRRSVAAQHFAAAKWLEPTKRARVLERAATWLLACRHALPHEREERHSELLAELNQVLKSWVQALSGVQQGGSKLHAVKELYRIALTEGDSRGVAATLSSLAAVMVEVGIEM